MYHKLKTILYHGTVSEIERVDVTLGRGRKDFGRGFYMAISKKQAVGMMHKKYKESVKRSRGKQETAFSEKLYEIALNEEIISRLKIKIFDRADVFFHGTYEVELACSAVLCGKSYCHGAFTVAFDY